MEKSTYSKTICAYFTKPWQNSWEFYKSRKLNPSISITTDLNSNGLRIHEGLAKAKSSLATQVRTEKIGLADFLYRRRVPTVTPPACSCGWYRQMARHIFMFCPLYDVRGREAIGPPANYHKLVSTAQTLNSVTSRLVKTGLLAQCSVAPEQLYG